MSRGGNNIYGTYGSVPTTENQGVSGAHLNVQATPQDFGAQVGQAVSNAGQQASDISDHFLQMVTEAKVNDDYANKYVPAAAQLRTQFDSLRGQDKVAGYEDYVNGLHQLNTQFTGEQPGILGQKSMSALINKHIEGEVFGAKRELVDSQKQFADQASFDTIKANIGMAAQNYNNPELVNSIQSQNNNHTVINHIDNGLDPNNPVHANIIADAQKTNTGTMATAMIHSALQNNDTLSANYFRAAYGDAIPGYQKIQLDDILHTANMQQTGIATVSSFTKGQPMPEVIGAPPSHVQALVANTAKLSAVNPNDALTILRIESNNGQNLGARGTLGQDKESAGQSADVQAKALCDNLKMANTQTTNALGRQAEPWETYVTYQQGAGGGPALLKAAQDNSDAKAVDILAPLYKNRSDALSAVVNNGGNDTMSASDFIDHIKQVYADNAQRANCDFSNIDNLGAAITAPHQNPGPTVQPAASPIQAQINYEKNVPAIVNQIVAIPNDEVRAGVMRQFDQERQKYNIAAQSYKNVITHQALQSINDPNFTNVNQLSSDQWTAIQSDLPQLVPHIEAKAEDNLNKQNGITTKEQKEWGAGSFDVYKSIASGEISTPQQIMAHTTKDGSDLTIAGADHMIAELEKNSKPDNASDNQAKKMFYEYAKKQIIPGDVKYATPEQLQNFNNFFISNETAYNKGISEGKTPAQLLTSTSSDYLGKSISQFQPSQTNIMAGIAKGNAAQAQQVSDEVQRFNVMSPKAFPKIYVRTQAALSNPNLDAETKQTLNNTLLNLEIVAARRGLARPRQSAPLVTE